MTWVKTQGVFTNKPRHKSRLMSESRSKPRCRSARWWLAPRLTFEYHNQTGICFTNTRNYCHRNNIYVLTSLLKQIYLQPTVCARIYCTVNTACHSCCHHREFTSWRTHERQCCYCGFEMTSQLLSRWFSFVNTTWLGPGPSLKWDSVRVQAKSWVKSQVKTVSEYGPWPQLRRAHTENSDVYSNVVKFSTMKKIVPVNYTRLLLKVATVYLSQ